MKKEKKVNMLSNIKNVFIRKKVLKEGCIDNFKDALRLSKDENVKRFETCKDLFDGGLTPELSLYNKIDQELGIEQVVMIREKNSFYIDHEGVDKLKNEILTFIKAGAKHFIFGYLNKKQEINVNVCNSLINVIKNYGHEESTWNFHMAIDETNDFDKALDTIIKLGFTRVLTKGGKGKAQDNIVFLKDLNKKYSKDIEILVGGSVTNDNFKDIVKMTKIYQVHGTKIGDMNE